MIEPVVDAFTVGVGGDTGAVASLGWVTPAPGRARRVMRTVSFFRGTEEVFGVDVFSGSLMAVNKILDFSLYLASRAASRQYLSPVVARFIIWAAAGEVLPQASGRCLRRASFRRQCAPRAVSMRRASAPASIPWRVSNDPTRTPGCSPSERRPDAQKGGLPRAVRTVRTPHDNGSHKSGSIPCWRRESTHQASLTLILHARASTR